MQPGSLRDIRLFVAAYEERSFTAAAARENATQSGVSQHVRNLEDAFEVQLFLRRKGQVQPTPAADSYYRSCIEVLRAHEAASRNVRRFAPGLAGEIVVGLMPTMTRCTIAPTLTRFVAEQPNVTVRVVEGYSAALTGMVRSGEIDFAIVPAFSGTPGLRTRLFLRTAETLVASAGADRPHLAPVRLSEIGPLRLVVPGPANTRRQTLDTYCVSNGVRVDRTIELDAMLGTLDFVHRTEWVAILPAIMMATEIARDHFTVNPLEGPALTLDLMLIEPSRRHMSEASEAFLQILDEETQRLNAAWLAAAEAAGGHHNSDRSALTG